MAKSTKSMENKGAKLPEAIVDPEIEKDNKAAAKEAEERKAQAEKDQAAADKTAAAQSAAIAAARNPTVSRHSVPMSRAYGEATREEHIRSGYALTDAHYEVPASLEREKDNSTEVPSKGFKRDAE